MSDSPSGTRPVIPATNRFPGLPYELESGARTRRDSVYGLRGLISGDDLSVVFQPIVNVASLRIFAYEALLRCRLEQFRDPTELFRRAVEESCTGRLGRMIREVAVPLCSGSPLFLNVHPIELQERWLVRPDDPLYFHDHAIYLEITESLPLTHFELCRDVLSELRARGNVHLVVDDLGAGYSNLKHIIDLEPSIVKIDRGLIAGLDRNQRQQRLVHAIARLCADLDAEVVAEGVETVDEWKAVVDTGIQYVQGYLLARPGYPLPTIDTSFLER